MRVISVLSALIFAWLLWLSVYFVGVEIQATYESAPKLEDSKAIGSRERHEEWIKALGPTSRKLKWLEDIRTLLILGALVVMPVPAILALSWRREFSSWPKRLIFISTLTYGWLAIPGYIFMFLLTAGGPSSG
jgi:hypothetical protein